MNNRLRVHHVIVAALVLGVAGCSSAASSTAAGSTAQGATAATSTPASTASSTPDAAAGTSADVAATTSSASASSAAAPARPADACTMLSSDQVASAVGTPGPYNDSHEDPADDGSPVWGCTWGTHSSDVDIREVPASSFLSTPDPTDITATPVTGIGDKARLDTMNPDGRNPELLFTAGGAYYNLSVTVDRSETGAANADQEKSAEQALGKLLAAKLSS